MLVFFLFLIASLVLICTCLYYFISDFYIFLTFNKIKIESAEMKVSSIRISNNGTKFWYKVYGEVRYKVDGIFYTTERISSYEPIVYKSEYMAKKLVNKILKRNYISKNNPQVSYIDPRSWVRKIPLFTFLLGCLTLVMDFYFFIN